jgi:sec-independent protein translocase protein TatC
LRCAAGLFTRVFAMAKSKDLFDDSSMSFGEHLEVLRIHLWKAVIGLAVCVIVALCYGDTLIGIVRQPVDRALKRHGRLPDAAEEAGLQSGNPIQYLKGLFSDDEPVDEEPVDVAPSAGDGQAVVSTDSRRNTLKVKVSSHELLQVLHDSDPEQFPKPDDKFEDKAVEIHLTSSVFRLIQETADRMDRPVTLTVQEAFLTYLKVSFISGFIFASPWVFYQVWLFVAAGLYPHERRYIYIYLPMSVVLFVGGALFCFFLVFPFVLDFLLKFNKMLQVVPQIRLSEWISFAVMLPLMFGLSFQLPLVMLFLERISIFEAADYREKRRIAVLVISIISMMMTPADPMSMIMMMIPLVLLYELGIWMCSVSAVKSPFGVEPA